MRVAMLCAAHKRCASNDLSARVSRDNLFAAKPVLRGNHRSLIETVADQRDRVLYLSGFCCHDAELAIGKLIRLRCCLERHMKLALSRDSQTVAVERLGVIFSPDKSPYLRNPRQVRRVQAADRPTTDDAHTLHAKAVTLPKNAGEGARATCGLPPFQSYQVLGLTDFFRYHRAKQTVGIVK